MDARFIQNGALAIVAALVGWSVFQTHTLTLEVGLMRQKVDFIYSAHAKRSAFRGGADEPRRR